MFEINLKIIDWHILQTQILITTFNLCKPEPFNYARFQICVYRLMLLLELFKCWNLFYDSDSNNKKNLLLFHA